MRFDQISERLGGVRNGMARCPAHDDSSPSLSVSRADDGRTLLRCHAGCSVKDVVAAVGITVKDLFETSSRNGDRDGGVVARYRYTDEHGAWLFDVVRRSGKQFHQEPATGKRGKGAMSGVRRVLYRLPDVLEAVANGWPVYICEGEKDCDAIRKAGEVATCNPGGAGKWKSVRDAPDVLTGATVIVVADADEPGRQHACEVAQSLVSKAASIVVVAAKVGKDAADHLAASHALEDLEVLAGTDSADPPLDRWLARSTDSDAPPPAIDNENVVSGVDEGFVTVQLSTVKRERVRWLWRGRVPLGKVAVFDGLPDMGKSTIATDLMARVTTGRPMPDGSVGLEHPANVVLFSAEDGLADTVRPRVEDAGGDPERIHVVTATRAVDAEGTAIERWPDLRADVARLGALVERLYALMVVVDVLMAYIDGKYTNSYRDQDMRALLGPLAAMAERTSCAVLLLRHPTKTGHRDPILNGGGSIGIVGAARVGLLASWHPHDAELPEMERRRLLAVSKCNIAPKADTMVYRLVGPEDGVAHVEWEGTAPIRAADMLAEPESRDEASERVVIAAVVDQLVAGATVIPAADVNKTARANGFQTRTLTKRLRQIGWRPKPDGFGGPIIWLPSLSRAASDAVMQSRSDPERTEPTGAPEAE